MPAQHSGRASFAIRKAPSPPQTLSNLRCLGRALDTDSVCRLLNRDWPWLERRGLTVRRCVLVRVHPRSNSGFVVEYDLSLQGNGSKAVRRVFGELADEPAKARRDRIVEALFKRRRRQLGERSGAGVESLRRDGGTTDLIGAIPSLNMVIRFPGLDEKLHGLKLVHDPTAAREAFAEVVGARDERRLHAVHAQLLAHRLGKRSAVRFGIELTQSGADTEKLALFAKLYKGHSDDAARVFGVMSQLQANGFGENESVRLPRPIACIDACKTLLMEDVPDAVALDACSGEARTRGLSGAGAALSRIHAAPLVTDKRYGMRDEIALLQRWVGLVNAVRPLLAQGMGQALERITRELGSLDTSVEKLTHRDYYDKQVLLKNESVILLDFDTLCRSDPAIDVGNFLAHIVLSRLQGLDASAEPERSFLEAYRSTSGKSLPPAVNVFERSALLRLACINAFSGQWCHLTSELVALAGGEPARGT